MVSALLQVEQFKMKRLKLKDLNQFITCGICHGYLIDCTTVTECLHSFCRSCIVKYFEDNNVCPTCKVVIHQSHPTNFISSDPTMQDIVYKLVSGLQEREKKRQREFYASRGLIAPGEDSEYKPRKTIKQTQESTDYHRNDEQIAFSLDSYRHMEGQNTLSPLQRKFIKCSSQATVIHLMKYVAKKLNLKSYSEVEILCNDEILGRDHTLKFIYVTRWRFQGRPLQLFYRQSVDYYH